MTLGMLPINHISKMMSAFCISAHIPSKKWCELIKKVWEVEPIVCQHYGAELQLIALIDEENTSTSNRKFRRLR